MDRSTISYTALHYVLLLGLIFGIVVSLERSGLSIPLWLGVLIALLVGILYPKLLRELGVAPAQWER